MVWVRDNWAYPSNRSKCLSEVGASVKVDYGDANVSLVADGVEEGAQVDRDKKEEKDRQGHPEDCKLPPGRGFYFRCSEDCHWSFWLRLVWMRRFLSRIEFSIAGWRKPAPHFFRLLSLFL